MGEWSEGVLMMVVSLMYIERLILLITWRFLSDHRSPPSGREKGNLSIFYQNIPAFSNRMISRIYFWRVETKKIFD